LAAGSLVLTGTQFIQNSANATGGGVHIQGSLPSRLVNALFARNSAETSGAALYTSASNGTTLLHLTVTGPGTSNAPAIHSDQGAFTLYDSILANYTVGISVTGGTAVENYNLFFNLGSLGGGITTGGQSFTGNPAFASPASDDYHLLFYSDAIDAGLDANVETDFEGDARPLDGGFDIGFDEYALQALFLPVVRR
jgi:predicted outer membrane repeat protein